MLTILMVAAAAADPQMQTPPPAMRPTAPEVRKGIPDARPKGLGPLRWYLPLGGQAHGPSGPSSARFSVAPWSSPSDALVATAAAPVGENDFQWIIIPLDAAAETARGVRVCYRIDTAKPGSTYISQVRLTRLAEPTSSFVKLDDPTDLTSTTATCVDVAGAANGPGGLGLNLKVVFGSPSDRILIGGIGLAE